MTKAEEEYAHGWHTAVQFATRTLAQAAIAQAGTGLVKPEELLRCAISIVQDACVNPRR